MAKISSPGLKRMGLLSGRCNQKCMLLSDICTVWDTGRSLFQSDRQQRRASLSGTAVPAFRNRLPKAERLSRKSSAPPQPAYIPAPTPSEAAKYPKKRILADIEGKADELDRDEVEIYREKERLGARRKPLREKRRGLFKGLNNALWIVMSARSPQKLSMRA